MTDGRDLDINGQRLAPKDVRALDEASFAGMEKGTFRNNLSMIRKSHGHLFGTFTSLLGILIITNSR